MIVRSKANTILRDLFSNNGCYIGLSTTTPDENGSNFTEPSSANGYSRAKLTVMSTPSNGQIYNTDIIFFPESLNSGWGTVTHFGVFTSASGGTPHFIGKLDNEGGLTIPAERITIFRAKSLVVGLDVDSLTVV